MKNTEDAELLKGITDAHMVQTVSDFFGGKFRYVTRLCMHVMYRYRTKVSSASEKVSIVRTETNMARFDWM